MKIRRAIVASMISVGLIGATVGTAATAEAKTAHKIVKRWDTGWDCPGC